MEERRICRWCMGYRREMTKQGSLITCTSCHGTGWQQVGNRMLKDYLQWVKSWQGTIYDFGSQRYHVNWRVFVHEREQERNEREVVVSTG